MYKKISITELETDLIASLVSKEVDSVSIEGFVQEINESSIFLVKERNDKTLLEIPKHSIIESLVKTDDSNKVLILVKGDAKIKISSSILAKTINSVKPKSSCSSADGRKHCKCSDDEVCYSSWDSCTCSKS